MILSAGFDRSEFQNLTGGIVALHIGYMTEVGNHKGIEKIFIRSEQVL